MAWRNPILAKWRGKGSSRAEWVVRTFSMRTSSCFEHLHQILPNSHSFRRFIWKFVRYWFWQNSWKKSIVLVVGPNEPSPSALPGGPSLAELLFDSLWRSWILCQRWMYVFWYFKTSSQCSRLLPRVNIDPPRVENPIGLSAREKLDELLTEYYVDDPRKSSGQKLSANLMNIKKDSAFNIA